MQHRNSDTNKPGCDAAACLDGCPPLPAVCFVGLPAPCFRCMKEGSSTVKPRADRGRLPNPGRLVLGVAQRCRPRDAARRQSGNSIQLCRPLMRVHGTLRVWGRSGLLLLAVEMVTDVVALLTEVATS